LKLNGWILIYGRKKVGKTFLIKKLSGLLCFFSRVNRDGSILSDKISVLADENTMFIN
jgi:AAA+ ATPase superfamily predicted ATPase